MRKVWITADVLAKRLKEGGKSGIVELACNEFLTPNAVDLADLRHVTVKRATPAAVPKALNGKPDAAPKVDRIAKAAPKTAIGLVLDRPTEKVRGLVDAMFRDGVPLADYTLETCWIRNTRALCAAVAAGELVGGVVIRPYAVEAVMLANKVRGIRAVQGTTRAAVAAALRQFKANVLVVEHAVSTFHEIRVLLATFAAGLAALVESNPLLNAVAELERSA
ncbi:MAG: RpiB/LacA/LacB family sugar-phosphate isomerase [Phycisphaerae bacterium]|nr:RpiB/LacA/LacB family sugar-phosphate isomerase [Phycisphaerae bacterium]